MRFSWPVYVVAIFIAGIVGISLSVLVNEPIATAFTHLLLATLTYPLGVCATLLSSLLTYLGLTTLAEALVVSTPIYAVLGYLWWYRILPKFRSMDKHNTGK